MNAEELLNTLRDSGLDDEAIKALLSDALASLDGSAEENEPEMNEEEQAGKLLGVEF